MDFMSSSTSLGTAPTEKIKPHSQETSCFPTKFVPHLTPAQAESLGFEVINKNGNPAHGTVLFFGQCHIGQEFKGNQEALKGVVASQKAILDELIQLKPQHVFVEGYYYNEYKPSESPSWKQEICQTFFKDYQSGQLLTATQAEMILDFNGAHVYAFLNSNVTLHGTTTEEISKQHDTYVAENSAMILQLLKMGQRDEVIFFQREKLAMTFVHRFLEQHPGQQVAFIFGANHDFSDCCDNGVISPEFYRKNPGFECEINGTSLNDVVLPKLNTQTAQRPLPSNDRVTRRSDNATTPNNLQSSTGNTQQKYNPLSLDDKIKAYPNDLKLRLERGTKEDVEHALLLYPNNPDAIQKWKSGGYANQQPQCSDNITTQNNLPPSTLNTEPTYKPHPLDDKIKAYPNDLNLRLKRGTKEDVEHALLLYPNNPDAIQKWKSGDYK